ncbi:MAG: ABC transporter substrate-binding protein [Candidatus Aminicenantia bacterium]
MIKKVTFFLLLLEIFSFSITYGKEKVYRIGILPWIAWTPLYVAEELGYFEEEGVKVEIINYANIREKLNSFLTNRTELTFGEPSDFIPLIGKGFSLKIVMCVSATVGADKFFIKKDIDLNELKGKKIALSPYPAGEFFVERGLKSLNIDPESLKYIKVDSPSVAAEALLGGKVDGAYVYPPSSFRVEKSEIAREIFNSKEFPVYEVIMCKSEFLEKENTAIQKILSGWLKAVAWSKRKENLEKFLEISKRRMYYRIKDLKTDDLLKTMNDIKIFSSYAEIKKVNEVDGKLWKYFKDLVDFLVRKEYIKTLVKPEEVINQETWKIASKKILK